MKNWWTEFFSDSDHLLINASQSLLIEESLIDRKNKLSSGGSLVVETGKFTGRAVDDKYVVKDDYSTPIIDWKNNIRELCPLTFSRIKKEMLLKMNQGHQKIFIAERSVGADLESALGLKIITTKASHALFAQNIFRDHVESPALGSFTIVHDPDFEVDPKRFGVKNSTVIAINFTGREIIIAGSAYAGEMKKAVFSVMNTLLPEKGILPMHSGANQDKNGTVSVFFGLSGTGKTTLATDTGMALIGDDEHGLNDKGVFNFEGGCYAKTYNLSEKSEPEIFKAANRFGSLLENVVLDPISRDPRYEDKSLTENARATYPLSALDFVADHSRGAVPSHLFFLSADALGVLPAASKLSSEQAMFYFLSGYTAKLAGTEVGLSGIKVAFSHCFGAPFMMRRPQEYGNLLKHFLEKHPINVWLINTGWYGGPYGEGKRYPLAFTRECVRAIQSGAGLKATFKTDPVFSLQLPMELGSVDKNLLSPMELWKDQKRYTQMANDLKRRFEENYSTLISNAGV
ncbi:MAG: phosphoenolpyruvate carboxykinase [Bacteriovorax sp.]